MNCRSNMLSAVLGTRLTTTVNLFLDRVDPYNECAYLSNQYCPRVLVKREREHEA